ncbi:MAG: hypothetical protein U1A77_01300 [Pirellulales bacterium]
MPESLPANSIFTRALDESRDAINERVRRRLKGGESIDGNGLLAHIRDRIGPIFEVVAREYPERARGTVLPLVDVSLDLFAASLLGPTATHSTLDQLWRQVLTACPRLLAFSPLRVAASLSNVAQRVATQNGVRSEQWLALMRNAAAQSESVNELLSAAAVAAWRTGMAQYRSSALDLALTLRPQVAAAALGTNERLTRETLSELVASLHDDVWRPINKDEATGAKLDSSSPYAAGSEVDTRGETNVPLPVLAGDFLGFGGPFQQPPRLRQLDGRIYVTDGVGYWWIHADAYGVFFQRVAPIPDRLDSRSPQAPPEWANASSHVWTGRTLAVTLPTSYHVFLVPLRGAKT